MLNKSKDYIKRVKSAKFALSNGLMKIFKGRYPIVSNPEQTRPGMQEWWNGRHEGLKILWPLPAVRVRVPLPVQIKALNLKGLRALIISNK